MLSMPTSYKLFLHPTVIAGVNNEYILIENTQAERFAEAPLTITIVNSI